MFDALHMIRKLACVASAGSGFSMGRPVVGGVGLVAGWVAGNPAA